MPCRTIQASTHELPDILDGYKRRLVVSIRRQEQRLNARSVQILFRYFALVAFVLSLALIQTAFLSGNIAPNIYLLPIGISSIVVSTAF